MAYGPAGPGNVHLIHVCRRDRRVPRFKGARAHAARPFVGNNLWVTSFTDPDGYRLDFESPTDVPEETVYSEPK